MIDLADAERRIEALERRVSDATGLGDELEYRIVIKRMEVVARVKELEAEITKLRTANAELQQQFDAAEGRTDEGPSDPEPEPHLHYYPHCTTSHECQDEGCSDSPPARRYSNIPRYGSDRYCCGP